MAEKIDLTNQILQRTKQFAIDCILICQKLQDSPLARPLCNQLVRSASSVGANYRATRRAKSRPDFINKFKIVEEELDESLFFLEIMTILFPEHQIELKRLENEGQELLKIIVASLKSLKN